MKKYIGVIVVLLMSVQFLFAGIISAKDAYKLSKDGKAVIVSGRLAADYEKNHIKDAVHIDHSVLYNKEGIKNMLKPVEEIANILGEKGITADKKIIIYDDGSNKPAGRLYWILEYMGAKDVDILNGHIKAWMKARKPITGKKTKIKAAEFKPEVDESKYASMAYIKENLKNDKILIVDVRTKEEYDGTRKKAEKNVKRQGHIPGAVNLSHVNVFNEDGTIKSKDEIAKRLKSAGITSDKEIILYCMSSVRAGIIYVTLTSLMDFPKVRVYDGAWWEWNVKQSSLIE